MESLTEKRQGEPNLIELRIESTAFGGKGVGRISGKVFFVEGGIEGDLLSVRIIEESDRYNEASIEKIIEPSPFRGISPCAVSDICGGCQWQGVPYEKQLEWKSRFIENALRRIGKLTEQIKIEMIPSPKITGYRNRILLRGRLRTDGTLSVGYFKRSSRDFVGITECPIAAERINLFIRKICDTSYFQDIILNSTTIEDFKFRLEVQDVPSEPHDKPHLLVTVYDSDNSSFPVDKIIQKIASFGQVLWCGNSRDLHNAPKVLFETHHNIKFHTSAGIFQQINIDNNHVARELVKKTVDQIKPSRILDIYCGSGNLSLALADGERSIDGVEYSKRAIEVAQHNTEKMSLKKINYYSGDTEKFLWRAAKQGVLYDLVIADPPREGMYKSVIPLSKIKPRHIIYISCDPSTLARDLGALIRNRYRIARFVALDFFPNTYHIESFVVLELT